MSQTSRELARYLAVREQHRRDTVDAALATLTERERLLIREAAVMGYVQGVQAGRCGDVEIPPDSEVLFRVVDGCIAMPDLYPLIGGAREDDRG